MGTSSGAALLSLIGVMLLWPNVLSMSVSFTLQSLDSGSLSPGRREELPRVVKRSTQSCDSTFDSYCLNNGQCVLLVDINEHHCKCDWGFHGHRCAYMEYVSQPMGETQIVVIAFCVFLLIIGLAGALYFFWTWYKKRFSPQKRSGASAVQTA